MAYDLTNYSNATNPYELLKAGDQFVGGMISVVILVVLFVIIVVGTMRRDIDPLAAIGAATFIVSVSGLLFILAGLIETSRISFFIIPLTIVIVTGFVKNHREN